MPRSESPSWKRQRLSSPTYDEQCSFSQEEMNAFDIIDSMLKTATSSTPPRNSEALHMHSSPNTPDLKRTHEVAFSTDEHGGSLDSKETAHQKLSHEVPDYTGQTDDPSIFASPPALSSTPHKRNETELGEHHLSSSFDAPPEKDDSGFFETSAASSKVLGFRSAASLMAQDDSGVSRNPTAYMHSSEVDDDDAGLPQSPTRGGSVPFVGFASALHVASTSANGSFGDDSTSFVGFKSALNLKTYEKTTSPSPSHPAPASTGFTSARSLNQNSTASELPGSPDPSTIEPLVLFKPASALGVTNKKVSSWTNPSAVSLARAKQQIKQWNEEISDGGPSEEASAVQDENLLSAAGPSRDALAFTPARAILGAVENSPSANRVPESPTPVARAGTSAFKSPMPLSTKPGLQAYKKPFRSPLAGSAWGKPPGPPAANGSTYAGSRLNPNFSSEGASISASPPAPRFGTPVRSAAMVYQQATPLSVNKQKFVPPFLPGMRPGEPGRLALKQQPQTGKRQGGQSASTSAVPVTPQLKPRVPSSAKGKEMVRLTDHDVDQQSGTRTLETCGLRPQTHTAEDFQSIGIDISELNRITPTTAMNHLFHSTADPFSSSSDALIPVGRESAFRYLLDKGYTLVTQKWVDNHWCLILWKLAGMVALDPASEIDPKTKRWCYREVIKQLLHRYERELDGGKRPLLRLIATGDVFASCPMTLCVSDIIWPEKAGSQAGDTSDLEAPNLASLPELELTDGWYKLRAEIDVTLAKAIGRGVLRVGRKISLATARLKREGKDAEDVLDAYASCRLRISGNSSYLAPWHAKLGLLAYRPLATLSSLTANGGLITSLNLVIVKQHPIGYMEFYEKDGKSRTEGPRDQREEDRLEDQWISQREAQANKVRYAFDERMHTYQGYIERLEHQSGPGFMPSMDESPPDQLEEIFETIEDEPSNAGPAFRKLSKIEAGWMARHIRQVCEKQRETIGDEISRELDETCPPRNVRNLRVLVVRDAQWSKKPPLRQAQLTVWNVLGIQTRHDDALGHFREGDEYVVTHLTPSSKTAWMGVHEGAEIYLTTRNESTWRRVGSTTHR